MSCKRILLMLLVLLTVNQLHATPIGEWAIWGPAWSRGGLGVNWYSREGLIQPQPGDLDRPRGWVSQGDITWQYLKTDNGMIDWLSPQVPEVSEHLAKTNKWAGASVYAHAYIWADHAQPAQMNYQIKGSYRLWFNGDRITDGKVRLNQGWNRLLVWMHSPAMINGRKRQFATDTSPSNWTMQFDIAGTQENDIENIRFTAFDPTRTTKLTSDNRPMRFFAEIKRENGESPIYFADEKIDLQYSLTVGLDAPKGKDHKPWYYTVTTQTINAMMQKRDPKAAQFRIAPTAQRFDPQKLQDNLPAKLKITVLNYEGMSVIQKSLVLKYGDQKDGLFDARLAIDFGKLPIDHYTVYTEYLTTDDNVLLRPRPHSFSVVQGPVDLANDTGPRVLSTVGHWLIKKDIELSLKRLRFLWRSGITRQQKLNQGWSTWGIKHDGKGNVTFTPNPAIDQMIAQANRLGITLVGDLSTGYIRSDLLRDGKQMPQTEQEQLAVLAKSKNITDPKNLVLSPYGAWNVPHFGHEAFEKTYRDYTHALVSHYKGKIDYWCGDNETDLHSGKGSDQVAEVYSAAVKVIYKTLKQANPNATYISPSLCRKNDFTYALQKYGFLDACDIIDVHAHPINAPDIDSPTIGNSTKEGIGVVRDYLNKKAPNKPVWYGEVSAPVSHSIDGAKGQVENLVKQLAWAINDDNVQDLSYLVVYNGYEYSWPSGMCNKAHEPLPAINAINTASHLLDGRKKMLPLKYLKNSVQQLRVVDKSGQETMVLWNHTPINVLIRTQGDVELVDLLGTNKQALKPVMGDKVKVTIGPTPVYLVGKFK